jgi:hypothetical protein
MSDDNRHERVIERIDRLIDALRAKRRKVKEAQSQRRPLRSQLSRKPLIALHLSG